MEIGYINFGQEERNNLYKVIQSIRDHHAIDELGVGRIRDAFSNRMFPGLSTLQNRAKYFVLLPSLYHQVQKGHYANVREVRQKVIDLEIKMTRQLLNGASHQEERNGITGSTLIDQAERDSSKYVKYDPSYIYWGGLVTFELVRTNGNIYQLLFERSRRLQDHPERQQHSTPDENDGDADDLTGQRQLFDTGGLTYTLDGKSPISVKLTRQEASFLKRKVVEAEGSKHSLLAYLLLHDTPIVPDFLDLGTVWKEIPDEFRTIYILSARFSRFTYLLRIFYNYVYCKKTGADNDAPKHLADYRNYLQGHHEEFTTKRIAEVLAFVDGEVSDMAVKTFIANAAAYVEANDLEKLEACLVQREKGTKGASRAKLTNWRKYQGKPHAEAYSLDYRWGLVYKVINELREGLKDGK